LGKGRFVCTASQSIAAVELLLLLLLLLGSRRKKKRKKVIGFAVSSCHYRYLVTVMSRQSSYLYKWDLGVCKAIRELLDSASLLHEIQIDHKPQLAVINCC
jgi:hypothetical protein